jgi:hypothetical protein
MTNNFSSFDDSDEVQATDRIVDVESNSEMKGNSEMKSFPPLTNLSDSEYESEVNDAEDQMLEEDLSRIDEEDFADEDISSSLQDPYSATNKLQSWDYRSRIAPREGEKDFAMFCLYRDSGSGRSTKYISLIYNLSETRILKIAARDNWGKRVADYDKYQLQLLMKEESSQRALEHKKKLEEYRLQQEFLGRSLTADAAKLAAIVSRSLDKFIAADADIDIKDVPGILAAASKAGDIGRNLQASSLGVDQLLAALEEVED